ncbi:ATP synthase F0 subunit 6 (mitochondrion) [Aplysia californica]|uniref:ATP synthase subunit a n=1 Tax=Aplysia californica TaxID=6500 RepID=Q6Q0B1_APLCA|nr:ATP synthase F0 subunit 6 [Aplysia californica]AAS67865.1 ATP synthase F0 subunit 6 [Aplysia californica]
MMSDLFSSLDCGQLGSISFLLWLTPIMVASMFFVSSSWKAQPSGILMLLIATNSETRAKALLPLPLFLFSLMFFLVMMNLIGLVPFVYGVTSNLWITSSLAVVMWGLLILSGWTMSPVASAAHLAPAGAPAALVPFLVLVETISIMIRPLTLTVRLIANISAGHIVMSLIANCLVSASTTALVSMFVLNVGYTLFEVFVCLIQAYIFTLLVKLYAEEHPDL